MAEDDSTETQTLSWGPNNKHRLLNTRLPRVDFPFKTTGTAKYSYDVTVPGMLHGRILRSPYAKAKITALDLSPALRIPGVKAAVARAAVGGIVRFEGDPVAAVAATTAEIAEDAIMAMQVTYEPLPFVVTAEDAIKPGAPAVYPDDDAVENNTRLSGERGNPVKVADALRDADVVVEAEYRTPTLHHCCLETHAVVVDYRGGDTATVFVSTQGTFSIPGDASRVLQLDESNVTGIVQYMGGGFGSKGGIGVEGQLACKLSKQIGAPVKMALARRDEFTMAGNGPGSLQKLPAGASNAGRLLAVQVEQYALGGLGRGSLAGQPYIYHAATFFRHSGSIHTNEDSARPLRAPAIRLPVLRWNP